MDFKIIVVIGLWIFISIKGISSTINIYFKKVINPDGYGALVVYGTVAFVFRPYSSIIFSDLIYKNIYQIVQLICGISFMYGWAKYSKLKWLTKKWSKVIVPATTFRERWKCRLSGNFLPLLRPMELRDMYEATAIFYMNFLLGIVSFVLAI